MVTRYSSSKVLFTQAFFRQNHSMLYRCFFFAALVVFSGGLFVACGGPPSANETVSEPSADGTIPPDGSTPPDELPDGTTPPDGSPDGTTSPDGVNPPDGQAEFAPEKQPEPTPETQPDNNPPPIVPLPATSFVFVRYSERLIGKIYIYDIQTKQERLLPALEGSGAENPLIALSPDRKWIAMVAFYKPQSSEIAQGVKIPSVWKISVDGNQVIRLSQPIPVPNNGGPCVTNKDCVLPRACNTAINQCQLEGLRFQLTQPQWSGDGKMLWTSFGQFFTNQGQVGGGVRPASVSADGGMLQIHTTSAPCQVVGYTSIHPVSGRLAAVHSVCSSGDSGLFGYNAPPQGNGDLLIANNKDLDIALATPIFAVDGSAILFKATTDWDTNNDGQTDTRGEGILGVTLQDGKFLGLLPPPGQGLSYDSFALAPDGKRMVACVANYNQGIYNLLLADFTAQTPQDALKVLSQDGKSCMPAW